MFGALQLGLSLTRRQGVGGYTFANAEASALAARFTTPPTNARKALIDTLVGALKTAGVWSKLDAFYILAAADSQAARQNWVADQYNLTAVSGPSFTTDRGYTGDGAASYLESNFNPTTASSPKFTQNDAHLSLWSRTNLSDGSSFGDIGNANSNIGRNAGVSGLARGRANTSGNVNISGSDGYPGYSSYSRTAAGVWKGYVNAVERTNATDASAALTNATFKLLRGGGFGLNQIAVGHWGSSLSGADETAAYNAINTYLQAVGAA